MSRGRGASTLVRSRRRTADRFGDTRVLVHAVQRLIRRPSLGAAYQNGFVPGLDRQVEDRARARPSHSLPIDQVALPWEGASEPPVP